MQIFVISLTSSAFNPISKVPSMRYFLTKGPVYLIP